MTARTLARWLPALSLVALGSLAVALQGHRRALAAFRAQELGIRLHLQRLETSDRLVGSRLPKVLLQDLAGRRISLSEAGRSRVLWLVSARDCVACFETSLREWNLLLSRRGLAGTVVLSGVRRAEGTRIARRAGLRSPLLLDADGQAWDALRLEVPSVIAVVDGRGIVVLADAQPVGNAAACGSGAFQRIAAVYTSVALAEAARQPEAPDGQDAMESGGVRGGRH